MLMCWRIGKVRSVFLNNLRLGLPSRNICAHVLCSPYSKVEQALAWITAEGYIMKCNRLSSYRAKVMAGYDGTAPT